MSQILDCQIFSQTFEVSRRFSKSHLYGRILYTYTNAYTLYGLNERRVFRIFQCIRFESSQYTTLYCKGKGRFDNVTKINSTCVSEPSATLSFFVNFFLILSN